MDIKQSKNRGRARLELKGLKFGLWTVLDRSSYNKFGKTWWDVRCECGSVRTVLGQDLVRKKTTNCGCQQSPDLSGKVFGRWTAITISHRHPGKYRDIEMWLCRCECGTVRVVRRSSLTCGQSWSCGCYRQEQVVTHDMSYSSEYNVWQSMIARCNNKTHQAFPNYGGRGITVCDRWRIFDNFILDMGLRPSDNLTIERIDNNLGYFPGNCRWASYTEQSRNKRNNVKVKYKEKMMTLSEISELTGIRYGTLRRRLDSGCPIYLLDRPTHPRIRHAGVIASSAISV